jgi:two-component system response regulator FixJ
MPGEQHIFVVDDDADVRTSMRIWLKASGFNVSCHASGEQFLADDRPKQGCLIADIRMPDMSGLDLQREIVTRGIELPVIIMTGHGDVPLAVQAMKAGAIDFIEKPFDPESMVRSIRRALEIGSGVRSQAAEAKAARDLLALLTPREHGVLDKLVNGRSNKVAADELGISPRTIEFHRAHIMDKMDARNLADLVRIVLGAKQGS